VKAGTVSGTRENLTYTFKCLGSILYGLSEFRHRTMPCDGIAYCRERGVSKIKLRTIGVRTRAGSVTSRFRIVRIVELFEWFLGRF